MSTDSTPGMGKVIQINEAKIEQHLSRVVRGTVEETLNALLEAEADRLVKAGRHERTDERRGYRAGHYERSLQTGAGEVKVKMPKLKGLPFETAIIERYRRREASVEGTDGDVPGGCECAACGFRRSRAGIPAEGGPAFRPCRADSVTRVG